MQTVVKDVMSEKKVVGQVEVQVFDNIDEACEILSEDKVLAYVNRAHAISIMDGKRRESTGSGSTGIRALMSKVKDNPELLAKIKELLGE